MLPDVDADEGHEVEERVLVRRRRDLEALRGRVQALYCVISTSSTVK